MEIVGLGTEIVECLRIGRMIESHGEQFLQRVFTDREIRHCQLRNNPVSHFSGIWAAKVAVQRALGNHRGRGLSWTDLEIRIQADGSPELRVRGNASDATANRGISSFLISISQCRTYATATVMAVAQSAKVSTKPTA